MQNLFYLMQTLKIPSGLVAFSAERQKPNNYFWLTLDYSQIFPALVTSEMATNKVYFFGLSKSLTWVVVSHKINQ